MAKKTLSCTIKVNDNFTTVLNKFIQNIQKSDNAFKTFSKNLDKYTSKIATSVNHVNTKLGAMQQKTNSIANSISNVSIKQANTMQQNQERAISNIEKRYQQMEKNIIKNLNNINKQSNDAIQKIGGTNSFNKNNTSKSESNKVYSEIGGLLSGHFTSVIGKLGLIGSAITGSIAIAKSINNALDSGFDILNKATGNMFSYDGIKEAMGEAMEYQTGRQSLDLFYGSKQKGLEEYKVATKVARGTYASETDTVNIISKLGMMGISVTEKQLRNLIDVAGTRPTVTTEHIGLAVQEALEGKPTMLNMYSINKTKLQEQLDKLKKSNPTEYKELKGAFNKKGGVGDREKYWKLLNSYIEQSPMHDYAKEFEQTVAGKLRRMDGLIKNVKSEILGMDIDTGEIKKGGAFEAFGNAVDKLKEKLEDPKTQALLEKIGDGVASVIGSISDSLIYLIDNVDWDKFAESIKEIGKNIATIIKQLVDSGLLEDFSKSLNTNVKKAVNNKVIDTETKIKTNNALINGDVLGAGQSKIQGLFDKVWNFFSPDSYMKGQERGIENQERQERIKSEKSWYTEWDISQALDKNKDNLTQVQRQDLKDMINNDGQILYKININTIKANNFDEIMESLKQAQNNRK